MIARVDDASQYIQPAEWYDRLYASTGKDYAAEAAIVDGIIRTHVPSASSLLDVGCGTGLHLEQFARMYDDVAGLDFDAKFAARARPRAAGGRVVTADMRDFDLGRRFDAVTSMFSAVGHMRDTDELDRAIARMAAHLAPDGVLVVEPWLLDEHWQDGEFGTEVVEGAGSTLVRISHTTSDGATSLLHFAWTEVSRAGIQRLDEVLRLRRFTPTEYREAFERAGLAASFDARGVNQGGRGLWIGRPAH